MTNKPNLTLVNTILISQLPDGAVNDFKPSVALRKMMGKYNCYEPDSNIAIQLAQLIYPDIDISRRSFTFKIVDSGYPNSNPEQYNDADYDNSIEELRTLPPGW